jgi:4-hydroxy-tetrahydrodipicolinate reductase
VTSAEKTVRIGLAGALGRMGAAVADLIATRDDVALTAVFDRPDTVGRKAHGLTLVTPAQAIAASDVIVDFSTPAASVVLAQACAAHASAGTGGVALVSASTGATPEQAAAIDAAARSIPVMRSGNVSLGVNLLLGLVRQAARALPAEVWDIEISEAHHHRKVDAPSGTALMLGQAAAEARGVALDAVAERARDGVTGPRKPGAIGFSVIRAGGIVGEHSVLFAAEDELITLSHSARDRSLFARGALAAAVWLHGRPAGLYDMQDVLGLNKGG